MVLMVKQGKDGHKDALSQKVWKLFKGIPNVIPLSQTPKKRIYNISSKKRRTKALELSMVHNS